MGWFDDQINLRKHNDKKAFANSILSIANAVTGAKRAAYDMDENERIESALGDILKFYHSPAREAPARIKSFEDRMEYVLYPAGIMYRRIELSPGWRKDAYGAMLGFLAEDHTPIALLPYGLGYYRYRDPKSGAYVRITAATEALLEREAYAFYRPFALKELSLADLARYIVGILEPADYAMIVLATLAVTLVGMLTSRISFFLFDQVIEEGEVSLLIATGIFLLSASIGSLMLTSAKTLVTTRIDTKMSICVEAATMMRLLSLPAGFFKNYGSITNFM